MPELQPNAAPSGRTPPPVIAARLALLLLAGAAAVWAFAFSEERSAGEQAHVHIHGAHGHGAPGAGTQDDAAGHSGEDAHAGHQMSQVCGDGAHAGHHPASQVAKADADAGHHHDHAANATPAASSAISAAASTRPQNHKVIGVTERRVFTLESRASAWFDGSGVITAVLRKDQLAGLSPGDHGMFFRANSPSHGIHVRLSDEPPTSWDEATSQVRFRLKSPVPGLRPGEVGWVMLPARSREVLVIPSSAVLYSPAGPYVLAAQADGRTLKRRVEIGTVSRGLAVVFAGLREGESIVVNTAFSWDAERRLQPQHDEVAEVAR